MESSELIRQRVFDPVQRVLHWSIGAAIMALSVLGWGEKALDVGPLRQSATNVHIALGFALSVVFTLRVVWGLIGPEQARFKTLWFSIKSLAAGQSEEQAKEFGYEGVASLAYVFLYLTVAAAVVSGLILTGMRYDQGPFAATLFDELAWHELVLALHNLSLYAATLFILAHVAGLIRHEKKSGAPVAQSMDSGYQYRHVNRRRGEP